MANLWLATADEKIEPRRWLDGPLAGTKMPGPASRILFA
jgi:hypothetical protein